MMPFLNLVILSRIVCTLFKVFRSDLNFFLFKIGITVPGKSTILLFFGSGEPILKCCSHGSKLTLDNFTVTMARGFLQCSNLEQFVLDDCSDRSEAYESKCDILDNLCVPLRHRNVYVALFGNIYLS